MHFTARPILEATTPVLIALAVGVLALSRCIGSSAEGYANCVAELAPAIAQRLGRVPI